MKECPIRLFKFWNKILHAFLEHSSKLLGDTKKTDGLNKENTGLLREKGQ